ncbi:MAG: hypothetical protein WCD70_00590 [Alphaproteobacteria bacterium]
MKRILIAFAAFILLPVVALAASPAPPTTVAAPAVSDLPASGAPDPAANPVLANLQRIGAKFFYLGKNSGMDGWFIIKNGQVQILYGTPDNRAALIGVLYSTNGDNVTVSQVARLVQTNKEVADLINSAQKEQKAIAQAGSLPAVTPAAAAPNAMPSTPASPGEKLIQDLSTASTVVIGANASSPEILMVMEPNCPHCQATWKLLRDSVTKGIVHLRMIPIGAPDSDDERAAAMLLNAPDALNAWDKYVGGDKTQLAGSPAASSLIAVRANHMLIDSWKIQRTPYLVYRAKDGKVKVVAGTPSTLSSVLSDLGL